MLLADLPFRSTATVAATLRFRSLELEPNPPLAPPRGRWKGPAFCLSRARTGSQRRPRWSQSGCEKRTQEKNKTVQHVGQGYMGYTWRLGLDKAWTTYAHA